MQNRRKDNVLIMYLAEAVAQSVDGYRPGARHAMLVFVSCNDVAQAEKRALEVTAEAGWTLVELKRSKQLGGDLELIDDETLRDAANYADEHGHSIVTYRDEVPANG